MSMLLNTVPAMLVRRAAARGFIYRDVWDAPAVRNQQIRWHVMNILSFSFGTLYIVFSIGFCAAFLANVAEIDAWRWTLSSLIMVVKRAVIIPLAMMILSRAAAAAQRTRKSESNAGAVLQRIVSIGRIVDDFQADLEKGTSAANGRGETSNVLAEKPDVASVQCNTLLNNRDLEVIYVPKAKPPKISQVAPEPPR